MDWLRKIVSGKRNRFQEQGFDLDITYITDKVLAMSFPASGLECMYRNKIWEVSICIIDNFIGRKFSEKETQLKL